MDPNAELPLIDLQIATLFVSDAGGRLRYIREPGYAESELPLAPRFFMGRTPQGNVWRFRHDLPEALVRRLEPLCRGEPPTGFAHPPQNAAAIRAALQAHTPVTEEERGPAYWIPASVPAPPQVLVITEANAQLLDAHFPEMRKAPAGYALGPFTAVVVDGAAVSIAYCARITAQAAEAGVQTAAAFRGRGYASTVVAGWAGAIRRRGLLPLYSTWWENLASQSVARRLGMVCYAEDWSIA